MSPSLLLSTALLAVRNLSAGCLVLRHLATPAVGMRKLLCAKSRQPGDPCNGTSLLPLATDQNYSPQSQQNNEKDRCFANDDDNVPFYSSALTIKCFDPSININIHTYTHLLHTYILCRVIRVWLSVRLKVHDQPTCAWRHFLPV